MVAPEASTEESAPTEDVHGGGGCPVYSPQTLSPPPPAVAVVLVLLFLKQKKCPVPSVPTKCPLSKFTHGVTLLHWP